MLTGLALRALADQPVYTDSLQNSWANYSWGSTVNLNNASPLHSGSRSVAVTITAGWGAFYLHHSAFSSSGFTHLKLWVHGGSSGGQKLQVAALLNGAAQPSIVLPPLAANSWQPLTISLEALGVANQPNLDGFWLQDTTGNAQPVFYVDDISVAILPSVTVTSPMPGDLMTAPATINFAASVIANGHTINKVQFFNGTSLVGEDASEPYSAAGNNVAAGVYTVSARVTYDTTETVDSLSQTIVVATNTFASVGVDLLLNRHPISPFVYGVAFASSNQLRELNAPLNRSGGNSETRYNWLLNAHSTANDWYFESHPDDSAAPGGAADEHVNASKAGGADPMLTIPIIGWTTKLGTNRARIPSFSVAKYGAQAAVDPYWSDAGNGVAASGGANITNDPNDANFATNSAFQAAFIQHLTNRWGWSTNGGVRFYLLDNEHTIWHSTHRDVHPAGATMQEVRDKMFDYAGVIKSLDPSALVFGPEEWGWSGYLYSGADQQWSGAHSDWNPAHFPDRAANGGWDYVPWLLDQFRQREGAAGRRLLDYCTLHVYPQANEFSDDVTVAMQLKRNRSTRQLWDTNYVDPTWINSVIKLIPRLKNWVATYYPGTRIGITEYNWGAEGHINGATAQADIYGIFGREGLDLGTRWTTPATGTPVYNAMRLFRNYDGNRSGFGDISLYADGPNADNVSVFAAARTNDNALTVLLINKQLYANSVATVNLTNAFLNGTGQVWQLTAANVIRRLSDLTFAGNSFTSAVPPQSITLFVLPAGSPPPPPTLRPGLLSAGRSLDLWVDGQSGRRYVLQATTNFVSWYPVVTNSLSSNSWKISVSATNNCAFYRAQWLP